METYRDFDAATLEREYSPSALVPDVDRYIGLYAEGSAAARADLTCKLNLAYGPSPEECLDLFLPQQDAVPPVQVFIHGGYWQALSKNESAASAADLVAAGGAFVALGYALAPQVDLDEIVRQTRAAIAWLYHNGDAHGIDPERIFVSGHSAGGHLVAMLLATDWEADFGVPGTVIKGATAVSGIYELEPIRLTPVNQPLQLGPGDVARLSPMFNPPLCRPPVVITCGGRESAEFNRQTADYAAVCRAAGLDVTRVGSPDRHHFDIIFDLTRRDTALGAAVLRQMGL